MKRTLIFGGAGFIGLNVAGRLLASGGTVRIFDRAAIPPDAARAFARLSGTLEYIQADVTDPDAVRAAVTPDIDAIVLGSAITAGPARESLEADTILRVNLLSIVPILEAARDHRVRRIVNLSSAAVYGARGNTSAELDEDDHPQPQGLYGITKLASEGIGARLSSLWGLDFVSLRLSAVFGPWERATGVRDTLSPQCQILEALDAGRPALLARPGARDWIYAVDVAEAISRVIAFGPIPASLYLVSSGRVWSALDWGKALSAYHPGFICRLAGPGEVPTIDLHAATDRSPMRTDRLAADIGWRARFDMDAALADMERWRSDVQGAIKPVTAEAL